MDVIEMQMDDDKDGTQYNLATAEVYENITMYQLYLSRQTKQCVCHKRQTGGKHPTQTYAHTV